MAKVAINLTTGSIQQEDMVVGIDLGTTNSLVAYMHPTIITESIFSTGKFASCKASLQEFTVF